MKEKQILKDLKTSFEQKANPVNAKEQKRYMKSRLDFWGIKTLELNQLAKSVFRNYSLESAQEYRKILLYLFENASKREEWYAAIQFALFFKAFIKEENLSVWVKMIRLAGWWDITDSITGKLIGPTLKDNEKMTTYARKWIEDENFWIRRTALLMQLKYKTKTDFELLKELILKTKHEDELFIQKAIGWALRQYSYYNPEVVLKFVSESELSRLSKREALKVIERKKLRN